MRQSRSETIPAPVESSVMTRPDIDHTLMEVAHTMADRATCQRLHVGAVLAISGRIVATGYNGTPAGMPHCTQPPTEPGCTECCHAEANAIAFSARHGIATNGTDLYVTHMPCLGCAKLIINAGIRFVHFGIPYRDVSGLLLLTNAHIAHEQLKA